MKLKKDKEIKIAELSRVARFLKARCGEMTARLSRGLFALPVELWSVNTNGPDLVDFVPSNIKNTTELLDILNSLNSKEFV